MTKYAKVCYYENRRQRPMNVSLTPELEHWVDEKVKSGRYASASEVIREGLRLLEEQEALKQQRLAEIRQKIDRALDQLDSGGGLPPSQRPPRTGRKKPAAPPPQARACPRKP